jgi:hypothetical protein
MMHQDSIKHRPTRSGFNTFIKKLGKNTTTKIIVGLVAVLILILLVNMLSNGDGSRSESYKKASGAAGLTASIEYDCHKSCKQKFNFNVYIFDDNGQQISVVRPDQHGKVNLAMSEGSYVMLVGKQFGKDKLFPQERILLKNGKSLELTLKYKEQ